MLSALHAAAQQYHQQPCSTGISALRAHEHAQHCLQQRRQQRQLLSPPLPAGDLLYLLSAGSKPCPPSRLRSVQSGTSDQQLRQLLAKDQVRCGMNSSSCQVESRYTVKRSASIVYLLSGLSGTGHWP
eukprot:scpid95156/ scgid2194/ 